MQFRISALIFPIVCVGVGIAAGPVSAKSHAHHHAGATQSAPLHSRHHADKTVKRDDDRSTPESTTRKRREEREAKAEQSRQAEQLADAEQSRHDRLAEKRRQRADAQLARQTDRHPSRHDRRQAEEAARDAHAERLAAIQAKKTHLAHLAKKEALSSHEQRLAFIEAYEAHQQRLAEKEAEHNHMARLAKLESRSGSRSRPSTAKAHAAHVEAAAKSTYLNRFAAIKAHEARLYAAEAAHDRRLLAKQDAIVARQEALRAKHKDVPSHIVKQASNSGLSIWQGDAYVAQVPVKIVNVNLNDPHIKVSALLARNGIGSAEPFARMIDRSHPNVAVTGTFFSLDNLRPIGDIVINGALAYFGGMGTALAITPTNHADMITVPWGHHHDWSGYNMVVACGPRLLKDSRIVLDPHIEHFKDRHMLAPNSRIAVGITKSNQLVFCMTRDPIYLGRLAKVMQSLGCVQAMNLDAGASTGFYCNGDYMARPGRWLTNAIVVYRSQSVKNAERVTYSAPEAPRVTGTGAAKTETASLVLAAAAK